MTTPINPGGGMNIGRDRTNTEGPRESRNQREFKINEKEVDKEKEQIAKEKEQKKEKSTTELTPIGERGITQMHQSPSQITEVKGVEAVNPTTAPSRIEAVNQLILSNVESLQVGKEGAILTLKTDAIDIPEPLQGAQMTLKMTEAGLDVQFVIAPNRSEQAAVDLLLQNRAQLEQLQASLQEKGLRLHQLSLGNNDIVHEGVIRSEITPPPRPFEAEAGREQRERGGEREGGKGEREPE